MVPYKTYNATLQSQNILVQAKNFLVFQGDVEAIASQSPKDLTKLIERISGSLELAREYDEAKKLQDKATESSTFNFTKRRGIMAEIKQFKEQKTEADKFEKLLDKRVRTLSIRLIARLTVYRIPSSSNACSGDYTTLNELLTRIRHQSKRKTRLSKGYELN